MKFDLKSLLKDKNVLYVVLFIAVTNMFAYLMFRQFDAIIFFVIIGMIASYFSKNMIIILLAAIISTNLAISIKVIGKVKEGLEGMKKEEKKKKAKGMVSPTAEPKAMRMAAKKYVDENFTQQLHPARINAADGDDIDSLPTVDYASTLESAYDNLDKLLSSDSINKMSSDTQRLAEKQQLLMGNINKLQPMMEKAGSLLGGLDMGKMSSMLDGLQGKLNNLGNSNQAVEPTN